jgi:hypothetical protein
VNKKTPTSTRQGAKRGEVGWGIRVDPLCSPSVGCLGQAQCPMHSRQSQATALVRGLGKFLSIGLVLRHEIPHRIQGLGADVVLNALCIVDGGRFWHANGQEEGQNDVMPFA